MSRTGDDYSNQAADICNAVQQVDDSLVQMALEDLPQEEVYEEAEDAADKKKGRSFFGKIGKGVYKRSTSFAKFFSGEKDQDTEDMKAKIFACRSPYASKTGGMAIQDPEHAKLCRGVLGLMIKQMGRNLLQGQNVMNTSFPIQCCQPRTILEICAEQSRFFHEFLPRAAGLTDPVERLKTVSACFIAGMSLTSNNFLKPLNPILGETLQCELGDGSRLYMEQSCHHPPVSAFLVESPDQAYKYHGHTTFKMGFGYNKMYVTMSGRRDVEFKDGTIIEVGYPEDRVNNLLFGEMHNESLGTQSFVDKKNKLRVVITYNSRSGLPSDFFQGVLEKFDPANPDQEGEMLSSIEGSWVGFVDFDKVRYWDIRNSSKQTLTETPNALTSDSRRRTDRNALDAKDYEKAQAEKMRLEEIQRAERKLREAVHGKHK
mmetsp:Transcript_17499/g.27083  ORF Transcript_17499/g.27083 Transcript_17499/m.27083 type:complete len:430 (+) Transcript_17499:328-1617(+)|eukprot:CAMPEP_0184317640 /NCGR_PEP_ID=MMETSP1049-20130417/97808_1 /TAXON_ID=77928 /ORGANISM="Proteomonas sulcata, Strain CCMP704" /LENGTH=429 /DNA_ID=CAMNT_0026637101 /DNA_START=362 /DNA_END=1651 /DNA_ORIENTATION=-